MFSIQNLNLKRNNLIHYTILLSENLLNFDINYEYVDLLVVNIFFLLTIREIRDRYLCYWQYQVMY